MKFLSKFIAVILLCSWGHGLAHLVHMGIMSSTENCPHAQNSHELCKTILNSQTTEKIIQKEILILLLIVTPFILIAVPVIRHFEKPLKIRNNEFPSLLQELFSSGILNPKAP